MKRTDACIFPYPRGDSSLRRMLEEAQELRFDACVAVYDEPLPEGIRVVEVRSVREALEAALMSE